MKFTGCSISEAIDAASLHPAQALNLDKERGSLEFGRLADLVLLDMDLNVQATYVFPHEARVCPRKNAKRKQTKKQKRKRTSATRARIPLLLLLLLLTPVARVHAQVS